jgi:hypothetical protein
MPTSSDNQFHPEPSGPRGFWAQTKRTGLILLAIFMVLGGYQLWDLSLRSHRFVVEVVAEVDTKGQDNSAEWLLQRLDFELVDPGTGNVVQALPAAPGLVRRANAAVRGRRQRLLVQNNRLVGYFYHPLLPHGTFRFPGPSPEARGDTLSSELTLERAQAFLRRKIDTLISVRDDRGRPVSGLQTYRGIPLVERGREPGVYDIVITVDDFIYQLEEHDKFTIDVSIESAPDYRNRVEVPAAWFTGRTRESHVVTLGGVPISVPASDWALDTGSVAAPPASATEGAAGTREPEKAVERATKTPKAAPPASDSAGKTTAAVVVPAVTEAPPPAAEEQQQTVTATQGRLRIRALPYADFYVDGSRVASQVGLAEVELAAGTHTVRIEHPYFKPHTWTDVVVEPGAEVSLFHSFPTKATGTVKVGWRQGWAEVFLDGKTTGKVTPCELTSVGVGPHVLTLVRDGAPVPGMRREIQVVEDGEVHVQF